MKDECETGAEGIQADLTSGGHHVENGIEDGQMHDGFAWVDCSRDDVRPKKSRPKNRKAPAYRVPGRFLSERDAVGVLSEFMPKVSAVRPLFRGFPQDKTSPQDPAGYGC